MFRQAHMEQDPEFQVNNGHDQNMSFIMLQVKMLQQTKMSEWQNAELH